MPPASTWKCSCPTPGGQAPVAVPAVTRSRERHARQMEAALGRGRGRPAEAAAVVVPRAASGQRWTAAGVHLHMVGQTPKVHLVQAVGMLMMGRCPSGGMTRGWESWKEKGGRWLADPQDVTDDLHFRPSYSNKLLKVTPFVIFSLVSDYRCLILYRRAAILGIYL